MGRADGPLASLRHSLYLGKDPGKTFSPCLTLPLGRTVAETHRILFVFKIRLQIVHLSSSIDVCRQGFPSSLWLLQMWPAGIAASRF